MKTLAMISSLFFSTFSFSQSKKVELYNIIKYFVLDSTGYSSAGDWAVGKPSTYPVKWQADKIEMSNDLKINFFRKGTTIITLNNSPITTQTKPMIWNVMLKGPRMGYSSFTIESSYSKNLKPNIPLDSLLFKNKYTYKLLKDCSGNSNSGFNYYEVKIPKKVTAWIKVSWNCNAGNCKITLDCYDDWSKQDVDLTCKK